MHWLAAAARRAALKGAEAVVIPAESSLADAWDVAARTLGLSSDELTKVIAPVLGLAAAELDNVDARALAFIPERIARQYQVFPLEEDKRALVVATADPTNIDLEQAVGFAAGRRIQLRLASPNAIAAAQLQAYGTDAVIEQLLSSVDEQVAEAVRLVDDLEPEQVASAEIDAAPVVKLTNLILRDAVAQGASDIHIEPGVRIGVVRFRVDGVLRRYMHLPMTALHRVVSRIKVLGKLDIADRIRPQDGRSKVVIEGRHIDLRISTVCTRDAEKAVIRILRPENTRKLDEIGITPAELARLRQLLGCRDGIVIVTGPTGSGKTTTLYSAIREIATGEINVSTVEDPVEYELAGITQIQIDPKRGITFANSLRALLRQDPDVIFVGEIRDRETAEIAAHAAMTGHLVLATLHTNDAISTIARLADLGLDRQTIAATLRGTLAQRLVRRLCTSCAQPVNGNLNHEEEALAQRYGTIPQWRAAGCKRCGNSGYRGRLPVVEVAIVTSALAEMIATGVTTQMLQRAAMGQGMQTMRELALAQVRAGLTTLQEVQRVVGDVVADGARAESDAAAILVVNADANWRRMARALLEGVGFHVTEAVDAEEAIRLGRTGQMFTLTVTDMLMPTPGIQPSLSAESLTPLDIPLPDTTPQPLRGASLRIA